MLYSRLLYLFCFVSLKALRTLYGGECRVSHHFGTTHGSSGAPGPIKMQPSCGWTGRVGGQPTSFETVIHMEVFLDFFFFSF